jgi:predicted Zn-dependent protease
MSNHKAILLASLLASALAIPALSRGQASAADHFTRGKELVEENCIDCMGGTQEGEEEAIRELEMALQQHCEEPIEGYKLLAEAYANMSTYVQKKSESESRRFWDKRNAVYRQLYQLAPNDPEVLTDYAETLKDANEKIAIYRKILTLKPRDSAARFDLGELLLKQDNMKDGLAEVKQALASESDPEAFENHTQRLIGALAQHGCPLQNSKELSFEAQKAEAAATYKEGDPKAMAALKDKLRAELDQHTCATGAAK